MMGAQLAAEGVHFSLWSTRAKEARVVLGTDEHVMERSQDGTFTVFVPGVGVGARYKFRLDDVILPDPYARSLPEGVHGPAEVVRDAYAWRHPRQPLRDRDNLVLYELHIGTFTTAGTYAAAQEKLPYLAELGVDAVELMPLSSFPGRRGWGYDGVAPFAPFAGYGTPHELRDFIDAAHGLGLGVILDVVYNHLGPDGNYLAAYSPEYFTARVKTPWGDAPNFAEPHLRALVLDNVRYWVEAFRVDGLRLDATHQIHDDSSRHILEDIAAMAAGLENPPLLIAEDDRNRAALVQECGLHGVWADDFHHQIHVLLTGERDGYYAAYEPSVAALATTLNQGWLYDGCVWPLSGAARGEPATGLAARALVYCLENHDQVGNRALGERLCHLVEREAYHAALTLLLTLPQTALLFMGQEWAASTPFTYFTDHNAMLGKLVTAGRRSEFVHFAAFASLEGQARIPDPQATATFESAKLRWDEATSAPHAATLAHVRRLLQLRRQDPVLRDGSRRIRARAHDDVLLVEHLHAEGARVLAINFGSEADVGSQVDLITGSPMTRLPRHAACLMAV